MGRVCVVVFKLYQLRLYDTSIYIYIYIKGHLEQNGMLSLFINDYPDTPNFIHKKLCQTLADEFHQNAFATIKDERSKLRTFALFKTEIGMEKYLNEIKNVAIRIQITRFRLSNHNLMIETGRHSDTPKEQRYCPFCQNKVETEIHFLTECPVYNPMRTKLIAAVNLVNPFFKFYTKEQKFSHLLSNVNQKEISDFIYKSFELRTFLTASQFFFSYSSESIRTKRKHPLDKRQHL